MPNNLKLISGRVAVTSAANVAADRYQYLDLSSAEPNLGTANVGDVLVYDSAYAGGRKWIPQGDIAGSIGQSAYVEANTASANTLYLSGVDNTQNTNITHADTKAQAAFDKANTSITTSGGSITGSLNVSQNLTVTGNLTVLGTTTTINTSSFTVADSLITLGVGNYTSDLLDIGISGHYNDGTNAHTGLIRDHGTKDWYLFKGYTPDLSGNNNIDINHASFAKANINADYFKGNVAFPDGTTQTSAATNIDSFARTTANSASSNTVIIQGVDNTQNTNITIATNAATAAFAQANATAGGLTSANTRLTIIEGVDTAQNTRMSIIEGVDTAQNTRMSIIEGVDTAQNTRMSIIEGVNVTQNTNITIIQGVDLTQNTNITNADTKAQAAFDKANDAYTLANTANTVASSGGADSFARQTANAAFTQANTATTLAQAAFNKANNTSDAVLTSTVDTYTGDGSNTAFTLSVTPATINYTTAVVGGVTQPRSAYSVVGTTLTFTSAPANNQIIEVTTIGTSNTTLYTVNNIISPFLLMGA